MLEVETDNLALPAIDKTIVASHFGKAAGDYDESAKVQHISGRKLEKWLSPCNRIMDLGCGTGFHLTTLGKYSQQLIAADISQQMLLAAKSRDISRCSYLQVDAEQLSLKAPSVDGIFSNMALQWCQSLEVALKECYSVIKPGGYMLFTTLLDGTLSELKQSWQTVNDYHHVNDFLLTNEVVRAIENSGFTLVLQQIETEVVYYQQAIELLRALKAIGANHIPAREQQGLTAKRDLQKMARAYEYYRDKQGRLPASYQVYYAKLTKV